MGHGLRGDLQGFAVEHVRDILHDLRAEDLGYHLDHFGDVVVRLAEEDDVPIREEDHEERDHHGEARGFIRAAVGLEGVVLRAHDHLPHPEAVDGRQILEADGLADQFRMLKELPEERIAFLAHPGSSSPVISSSSSSGDRRTPEASDSGGAEGGTKSIPPAGGAEGESAEGSAKGSVGGV